MATDRDQADRESALEVDREFTESDSSYGLDDTSSEITSLSSTVTAYVRLPHPIVRLSQRSGAYLQSRRSRTAAATTPTKPASTTNPTTKKKWTAKT